MSTQYGNDPSPEQPSLLSHMQPIRNESPKILLQRIYPPPENEMSLFKRILTSSSPIVEPDESLRSPPPRNCLSPWNGSPPSRPIPERRLSCPISLKSRPLIERITEPPTLLERLHRAPLMKRRQSHETETPQQSKRKRSLRDSSAILTNDERQQMSPTRSKSPDLVNVSDLRSQICRGLEFEEPEHTSIIRKVAPKPVSSLSSTEKTFREASSSCELLPALLRESKHPNGSVSSGENLSISTISCLQLSALQSMRTARRALERHNSLLLRMKPNERSDRVVTGRRLGDERRRPSSSLFRTAGTNSKNTLPTSKPSSMRNIQRPTNASYSTTLQLGTSLEADKPLYSPNVTVSPTFMHPLSSQMESNSSPRRPHVAPDLEDPHPTPKYVTNTTHLLVAPTPLAATNTPAETVGETIQEVAATRCKGNESGLQPKYLRYNLWGADHQKLMTTAEWSETACPLPRPPDSEFENVVSNSTLTAFPHLFSVHTPINIDRFSSLLHDHPNPCFVESVITGLREGFWPWSNTRLPGYPDTYHQPPNGQHNDAQRSFFREQLHHERASGRYSEAFGDSLLPGMYSMPIYGVPKPGSDALHLVNDHSAGPFSLNSMIDHPSVTGYPLDNLHLLGRMLLDHRQFSPSSELVMWKSDISEAYRICPMHPLWQIKQAVSIDGQYYIDRANCFGSSASFAIFISVNSLVAWITRKQRGVSSLITYVDDSSGPAVKGNVDYYAPYQSFYPTPQTTLLCLWDELGIPHKEKKQVHGMALPVIGIDVDPNALSFSLPPVARERLTAELETWISPKTTRLRLRRWQKLGGWLNWVFNVYPLLRPCLTSFYRKISGKMVAHQYVHINNDVRDDFSWALETLTHLQPVLLLQSLAWQPSDTSLTVYCDACPEGLGFWFPSTSMGYYSAAPTNVPPLIFYLEALCVLSALELSCDILPPSSRLLIYTDNQNTVDIFSSLRCLPEFSHLLQTSITLRTLAYVDVRVLHVPGIENEVADALSRADFHRALSYSPNLILNFFTPCPVRRSTRQKTSQPPRPQLGAIKK